MATADPNVTAYYTFIDDWAKKIVNSKIVDPKFYRFYPNFVGTVAPPTTGVSQAEFDSKINEVAERIKAFFTGSGLKDIRFISSAIDKSKPTFGAAPPAAPATSTNSRRFFTREGGISPAVDYPTMFDNLKAIAASDIQDIETLLSGTGPTTALKSIEDRLSAEKVDLEGKVASKQAQADALNQQFVDERTITGKVTKPKVMVLQDWILAGFAVAYFFFAVVAVLYVSSRSVFPVRAGLAMMALMFIVAAVIYSWISYIA